MPAYKKTLMLRLVFLAAVGFNFVWLIVAPVAGMFREHMVVRSDTIRAMAFQYYGEIRPHRAIEIALDELYGSPPLTTSITLLKDLHWPTVTEKEGALHLVDDPASFVTRRPTGTIEVYTIGPEARQVGFLVPESKEAEWAGVAAVQDGGLVLFVPLAEVGE